MVHHLGEIGLAFVPGMHFVNRFIYSKRKNGNNQRQQW